MDTEVRPATPEDAVALAARLRHSDEIEVWLTSASSAQKALLRSLAASDEAWTGLLDGVPVCMFGVGRISVLGGSSVWLLGSPEIETIPRAFLVQSRDWARRLVDRHGVLRNYVWPGNRQTMAWLRRLGARFGKPMPYGAFGRDFIPFEMGSSNV